MSPTTPGTEAAGVTTSGRPGSFEELLGASSLPGPLVGLVRETVRHARLWRAERVDVADELIAHFQDGLDAGRSADELTTAFGATEQAGRLIRRAKRRQRPRLWRIMRRSLQGTGALVGLLLVVYLYAAFRFFIGEPTIAVDYVAKLSAKAAAVPVDQQAWPLYRTALVAIGQDPDGVDLNAQPGDERWAAKAVFVTQHADTLETVRRAARRPGLGFVPSQGVRDEDRELWPEGMATSSVLNAGMLSVRPTHLGELRRLAQLMEADAQIAAQAGDASGVVADIETMLRLAEHVAETSFFISELTSMSIITLAVNTTGGLLRDRPGLLDDEDLLRLAHRFSTVRGGGRLIVSIEGERMFLEDVIQRIYTDDGHGNGRIVAAGIRSLYTIIDPSGAADSPLHMGALGPAMLIMVADRRAMTREYERLMGMLGAEQAKPLWLQDAGRVDIEIESMKISRFRSLYYHPLVLLMPALSRAVVFGELITQRRDALLTAIALEIHRRRHGMWPETLDTLVPDLLPAVPPDRVTGQPLRYTLREGRPVLYSVGRDRDDNGGTPPSRPVRSAGRIPDDGDWILWEGPVPAAEVGEDDR